VNKEIWKDILGGKGLYQVSNLGRTRSFYPRFKSKVGIPRTVTGGRYAEIYMRGVDKKLRVTVHRAVFEAFNGKIPSGMQINHIDGDKKNNRLDNLECVSSKENNNHAYRTGLRVPPRGSEWHSSKLNEEKVSRIKSMISIGLSQQSIADTYKVNQCTISDIKRGVTWQHVRAE
jgi:hypothetical protein